MKQYHKTSQALQDRKMTLNRATNLLQGLQDFVQTLKSHFQEFEERGKVLSGSHHYIKEISREKKRKVRLDSEGKSEGTLLNLSNKFKIDSYLPIIEQIFLFMKTRFAAYDRLRRRFLFLAELNTNCKIDCKSSCFENEKHQTQVSLLLELVSDAYLTANRTDYLWSSRQETSHHLDLQSTKSSCLTI